MDLTDRRPTDHRRLCALTFDPVESDPYHLKVQDLVALPAACSLVKLRAYLFLEQRRWNHFGRKPDSNTTSAIRGVLL